jgi:SAM-dependent methyltransferase
VAPDHGRLIAMEHADHVRLIRGGVKPGVWAELGSGTGAFTLALADVLGRTGSIVSVDRDGPALRQQAQALAARFPGVAVTQLLRDFRQPMDLPLLDGLLMANSLHFVEEQRALVSRLVGHLRPGGRFVLVEYDAERGNPWVPRPVSFRAWTALAVEVGLVRVRLLERVPSRFLGSIYAAVAEVPA